MLEKKIIKEKSNLTIKDLVNHSSSKKNVYIKILLGSKLTKSINIESHAASDSAKKEFERSGGSITIVKFEKIKSLNNNKSKNKKAKDAEKKYISKTKKVDPKSNEVKPRVNVEGKAKSKTLKPSKDKVKK